MFHESRQQETISSEDTSITSSDDHRPGASNRKGFSSPVKDQTERSQDISPWLRPFFSLRAQLFISYCGLLALVVLVVCLLVYQQQSHYYVFLLAILSIVGGSILAFVLTTVLLRPLQQVIDAAQAIAVGDFQQRERLPLRLPPQDDVDRLAGSIDEMATRLESAEELQHASEQRFKRFFSDASHQLRTPLTSIRGFTEILMRGAIDEQETRLHVLARMRSEAERMTSLINDLLTLARLDDSHLLKFQYVDLVEVAAEEIERAKTRSGEELKITLDLATKECLAIQADRDRVKQLLFILLDNALRHGRSAPNAAITMTLDKQKDQAIVHVIDNGEGIDKEDLAHIFDSFYRGKHRAVTHKIAGGGVGLGLTIAHTIVKAHHGTISVSSEPGKGTDVMITLPCIK